MQKISLTIKNNELEDFFILFLAYVKKKQYLCKRKGEKCPNGLTTID